MAAACALAIISGRIIFIIAFVALCGARQTHFYGWEIINSIFPQNRHRLSLAGEPENRQVLTERGVQEKFSAVVTSVISVQ